MVKQISYMDVLMGKSSINNPEDYLFVHSHGSPPPRLAKTRAGAGHGFRPTGRDFTQHPRFAWICVWKQGKSQDVNEKIRINHEIWACLILNHFNIFQCASNWIAQNPIILLFRPVWWPLTDAPPGAWTNCYQAGDEACRVINKWCAPPHRTAGQLEILGQTQFFTRNVL